MTTARRRKNGSSNENAAVTEKADASSLGCLSSKSTVDDCFRGTGYGGIWWWPEFLDSRNYQKLLSSHMHWQQMSEIHICLVTSLYILHSNHPHFYPVFLLPLITPLYRSRSSKLAVRWNCPSIQNYYANPTLFFVGFSSTTSLPCFLLLFSRCFSTNFVFAASCIHEKAVIHISFYTSYRIQNIMPMKDRWPEVKSLREDL